MLKASARRLGLAATAAVLAVGVACGGGPTGSSAEQATDTIKFMTVAAVGSGLTNYPDVEAGAKAAVQAINAAGGVNGKQISWSFCNTRGDANQATACARQAQADGVAAVVGQVDIFSTQSMPVLEKAGIPVIGNVPAGGAVDYENPVSYPLHEGNYGAFTAAPFAFKAAGKKKMVIVAADFAATAAQVEIVNKAIAASGMPNGSVILVPVQGVTDYAPYAQQIKDQGADAALIMLGPQGLQAIYKATDALGIDVQLAGTVFSFGEAEAQAIGESSDGVWVLSPIPASGDTTDAAIARYNDELTAAGVDGVDPALRRAAGLNAWLAVYAAAAVTRGIEGEVTAASLAEELATAKDVDVAGVLDWSPATLGTAELGSFPRLPSTSYQVLTFQGGKLVASDEEPINEPLAGVR